MNSVEIIENKLLTIINHFGFERFADLYINGGTMFCPLTIKNYYDLDKLRDNKILFYGELGKGHFQSEIGIDCDKYRKLKSEGVEFTDEVIKSCLYLTDCFYGTTNPEYDQLHAIKPNGEVNKNRYSDELLDEIAEYLLPYDEAIECRKRFLAWAQKEYRYCRYAAHVSWKEIMKIEKRPFANKFNEVFIRLKSWSGVSNYELDDYPVIDENGKLNKRYNYLIPYNLKNRILHSCEGFRKQYK